MIASHVVAVEIVAGVKVGAGADDVVRVRDTADRDLSRNSTMALQDSNRYQDRHSMWGKALTFVSVMALKRLVTSPESVFSSGTTNVGTVALGLRRR